MSCQPTGCIHGPVRLGTCRAGLKSQQLIVLIHKISLLFLPKLYRLCPYDWKISLFCISHVFGPCLIWLIKCILRASTIFLDRAVPCRPTVPREQPKRGPAVGLGRNKHDPNRAVLCLGRTKLTWLGLGRGTRAIWLPIHEAALTRTGGLLVTLGLKVWELSTGQ